MVLPESRVDPKLHQFLWPSSDHGLPFQLREPEPKLLKVESLAHHELANGLSSISLKADSCSREELT